MATQKTSSRRQSDPLSCLGPLLQDPDLLPRILAYVVADSVRECRRVCRLWKTVCDGLSIRLGDELPPAKILQSCTTFPNATELGLRPFDEDADNKNVFAHLSAFPRLKHLYVDTNYLFSAGASLSTSFANMLQLESLSCDASCEDLQEEFFDALRHLTNLTKLEMPFERSIYYNVPSFSELLKLRDITLPATLLHNAESQLLFLPTRNLTRLVMGSGNQRHTSLALLVGFQSDTRSQYERVCLQIIYQYARSLRALELHVFDRPSSLSWDPLRAFTKLERLYVFTYQDPPIEDDLYENFCDNIKGLTSLTDINLELKGFRPEEIDLSVLQNLSRLQSLCLERNDDSSDFRLSIDCLSHFRQLRHLVVDDVVLDQSLTALTHLESLVIGDNVDVGTDLGSALAQMCQLTRLVLSDNAMNYVTCHVFSHLKKLQDLMLHRRRPFLDYLLSPILASLQELTSLVYVTRINRGEREAFFEQLNQLTQLRRLVIDCGDQWKPCAFLFEGSFPRLWDLTVNARNLTEQERHVLFQRFPCLQRIDTYECEI